MVDRPHAEKVIPVVVIDLANTNGVTVEKKDGVPVKPKFMWYIVTDYIWTTKWASQLSNLGIVNPAGHYFIMNFPDNPKSKGDARYAGQNMSVSPYSPSDTSTFMKNRKALDDRASNPEHPWTRSAARATLPEFGFMPYDEIVSVANRAKGQLTMKAKSTAQLPTAGGLSAAQLPAGLVDADPAPAASAPATSDNDMDVQF